MSDFLLLTRDTMGWWGALAGFIGLADINHLLPTRLRGAVNPLLATVAMVLFCLFLILVGTALPLHTRIESFAGNSLEFQVIRAVGWTFIATAGWLFIIDRAPRPAMLSATAVLSLGGTALAAALTAGGA